MIIEVCANSYESANKAEQVGANRVELCKKISFKSYVLGLGNQCVTPENR
jgi:copper homeostasis protein CutC